MREIKFRGRHLVSQNFNGVWVYGSLYSDGADDREPMIIEREGAGRYYPVVPETVGQLTGLLDSNGQEIYEGDVLEYSVFDYQGLDVQYRGVVEWDGARFIVSVCLVLASTWRKKRDYEESYYDLDCLLDQDDEAKIIGNVHDNPNLLEAPHAQSD